MGSLFVTPPVPRVLELLLLAAVIIIFIGRLVLVSAYQQRTGDYFSIRLMVGYPTPEPSQILESSRLGIISFSNLLAKIMWVCVILLFLLYMAEQQ